MENDKNIPVSDLISRVRKGEDVAFSELLEHYMPMIKKAISTFKNPSVRSDEILCEASVAFYRAVMSYDLSRTDVTFGLYARICVYRRLVDLVGKQSQREQMFTDLDVTDLAVSSGIENFLVSKERFEMLMSKIRLILSDYEFEVFRLNLDGYTTAQIAKKLGKSAKSVDNAKSRCMRRLKEESSLFSDI